MEQSGNVGRAAAIPFGHAGDTRLGRVVWSRALAFGSRDVKQIALNRERGRIPLGRDPGESRYGLLCCFAPLEIKDGNRVRAGVGGKEPLAILGHGNCVRHGAEISLPGEPRVVQSFELELGPADTHGSHRIPVGEGHIKNVLVRAPGKSGGMGAGRSRLPWSQQIQLFKHLAVVQIQLRHRRAVPQGHVRATPGTVDYDCDGIGRGHHPALRQVKPAQHLAGDGVHQQNVIGEIVRNQQFIGSGRSLAHRDSGRRRNRNTRGQGHAKLILPLPYRQLL